jgi:hypothetical protein
VPITPLGSPVEPDVKSSSAMLVSSTAGGVQESGSPSATISSIMKVGSSSPGRLPPKAAYALGEVIMTVAAELRAMPATRCAIISAVP